MDNKQVKRSETRKPCEQKVTFELSADKASRLTKNHFNGRCVDISKYGMGLKTEHQLERSQVIKLYMPMKHTETDMPVFAEVVWSKPDNGMSRTGLRFLI